MKVKALILVTIFIFNLAKSDAQNIYAFAGNGSLGYTGDGSSAILAQLNSPYYMTTDGSGNVYIVDQSNSCIRKVSPLGIISTVAGTGVSGFSGDNGQATLAQFNAPSGIALDGSGNMYVADQGNSRVRKINTSGIITTIAGNGGTGSSGDGGLAINAEVKSPMDVVVDALGNVYISDMFNQRIRKVTPTGTITTIAGIGTPGFSGDGAAATSAELFNPQGLAIDAFGNLYIADKSNERIRKINSAGIISTVAGIGVGGYTGDGGLATAARLCSPADMAFDSFGNMYITDACGTCVRTINTSSIISTIAGSGSPANTGDGGLATAAQFFLVKGIAIDAANNVYVCDNGSNRVRVICPSNCFTNVDEIENVKSIPLYPNPASNSLFISTEQNRFENSEIEIINYLGQIVMKSAFKNQLDVSQFTSGCYILKIYAASGVIHYSKFVKE